ncbi:Transforming protein v-Fos/v-Fox [Halotydeus destructor]|nr:Transforming protein v-Fos/v-Fox [Halotydeus destructor]
MYSIRNDTSYLDSMHHVSYANIGGPTQTTPTLTPTTLKCIQEALEFEGAIPQAPMQHRHQAGFVPPIVNIVHQPQAQQHNNLTNVNLSSNNYNDFMASDDEDDDENSMTMYSDDDSSSQPGRWNTNIESGSTNSNDSQLNTSNGFEGNNMKVKKSSKSRSAATGRKPRNRGKMNPEEDDKRRVRRERNKLAAARCRKRRLDHTNELIIQTEGLNDEQNKLRCELEDLQSQAEKLKYILDSHKSNCKLTSSAALDVKPNLEHSFQHSQPIMSRCRPSTLPLTNAVYPNSMQPNGVVTATQPNDSLVPIQTPSNGISLDTFLEGGTGLTPFLTSQAFPSSNTPSSCSGQQRNVGEVVVSPDNNGPRKLVSL